MLTLCFSQGHTVSVLNFMIDIRIRINWHNVWEQQLIWHSEQQNFLIDIHIIIYFELRPSSFFTLKVCSSFV